MAEIRKIGNRPGKSPVQAQRFRNGELSCEKRLRGQTQRGIHLFFVVAATLDPQTIDPPKHAVLRSRDANWEYLAVDLNAALPAPIARQDVEAMADRMRGPMESYAVAGVDRLRVANTLRGDFGQKRAQPRDEG